MRAVWLWILVIVLAGTFAVIFTPEREDAEGAGAGGDTNEDVARANSARFCDLLLAQLEKDLEKAEINSNAINRRRVRMKALSSLAYIYVFTLAQVESACVYGARDDSAARKVSLEVMRSRREVWPLIELLQDELKTDIHFDEGKTLQESAAAVREKLMQQR